MSCLHFTVFFLKKKKKRQTSTFPRVRPHLAVLLKHVTVCVSCLSPEVYLSYLWGWVTMANPVFRWLFSTLRRAQRTGGELLLQDSLTRGHLRHCQATNTDTEICTHVLAHRKECFHMHSHTYTHTKVFTHRQSNKHRHSNILSLLSIPGGLAFISSLLWFSLSVYYTAPFLVFLCLLSFPDQSDSCSH